MAGANFKNVLVAAKKAVEEKNLNSFSGIKSLYPGDGATSVRILFNPKSGEVFKVIKRHWSDELKRYVPCLSMYGIECPMCQVSKDWEEAGNDANWKLKPQTRGLAYVTTGAIEAPNEKGPKPGETALLVMPSSVYSALNTSIAGTGGEEELAQLLTAPTGVTYTIVREKKAAMTEYTTTPVPFPSKWLKTAVDQPAMDKLLEELPDIREAMYPSKGLDKDAIKQVHEAATKMRAKLGLDTIAEEVPTKGSPPEESPTAGIPKPE